MGLGQGGIRARYSAGFNLRHGVVSTCHRGRLGRSRFGRRCCEHQRGQIRGRSVAADSSLAIGQNLYIRGDPAGTDSLRAYTALYPEDAEGWYLLGESEFHTRPYGAYSPAQLLEPFDRALALDSTLTPAAMHPMAIAVNPVDTALVRRYLAVFLAANASTQVGQGRAMIAIAAGANSGLDTLFAMIGPGEGGPIASSDGHCGLKPSRRKSSHSSAQP